MNLTSSALYIISHIKQELQGNNRNKQELYRTNRNTFFKKFIKLVKKALTNNAMRGIMNIESEVR